MTKKEQQFIATVWQFYKDQGRHTLPWRHTVDPYQIAVSEVMLQQTQVDRVLPKYMSFIKKWPTSAALAGASLAEILVAWQGLGYNRRARLLHHCAQTVVKRFDTQFPDTYEELLTLPGIGPYTAGAICAFAYNQAIPILETNIKTAYIHHFFSDKAAVTDTHIKALVAKTLDHKNPRTWYWAMMDYGSYLKKTHGNNIMQSASYKKQSPFKDSDRQIRGAIVRTLTQGKLSRSALQNELGTVDPIRLEAQLQKLLAEGMLFKEKRSFKLPS